MKCSLIFGLSLIFLLTGCSPFSKEVDKRIIAEGLSPKIIYQDAKNKADSGSLEQSIDQYKILLESYPGSKYAIQARLDISYNLFQLKKYNLALDQLNKFIAKYPALLVTPYAYYLRGVVAEEKSSSILDNIVTDSAQRDVESIRDAYKYYNLLIERFPDSEYTVEAKLKLVSLKNTLSRHEFYVAIYYTNKGSFIGAINRSKFIIENYPNSNSIPDALHLMAQNYDSIGADNLAKSTRIILKTNFPGYIQRYKIK
tara:strand:- start:137 stop:904 length:768 start_codon:yes stop_codon:yes gene_type:complete